MISTKLRDLRDQNCIIGGDFNAIRNIKEKQGGIFPSTKMMEEFDNFIYDNDLSEVRSSNGIFSWFNKRDGFLQIAEKLDRFLIAKAWNLTTIFFSS